MRFRTSKFWIKSSSKGAKITFGVMDHSVKAMNSHRKVNYLPINCVVYHKSINNCTLLIFNTRCLRIIVHLSNTMMMQMVDIHLLSFCLLTRYQPICGVIVCRYPSTKWTFFTWTSCRIFNRSNFPFRKIPSHTLVRMSTKSLFIY